MIENLVESTEFRKWCDQAETPEDVVAVLEEFKEKDVFLKGWRVVVRVLSAKYEARPIEVTLKASCLQHPTITHQDLRFVTNGGGLYNSFLDMVTPYRIIHPYHD